MRIAIGLPLALLISVTCAPSQAQVYKCREANGALLYTGAPCRLKNAKTISVMPKGRTEFIPPNEESDAAVQEELTILSGEEADLLKELDDVQAAPGESLSEMPKAHVQRIKILNELEWVRNQKRALLGRGLSSEDSEELVDESKKSHKP